MPETFAVPVLKCLSKDFTTLSLMRRSRRRADLIPSASASASVESNDAHESIINVREKKEPMRGA
ncbi:hypothetical protein PVK06_045589 [Gossypium arboreum]|uniref:Uncharacterized protein n=1 Tax=Gossypium arboreum TaxID=29729 RepID=A0ABR0MUZ5_GOSAR|nr:hypothetical protein PVK06_045589 [Gossypium arboreum]